MIKTLFALITMSVLVFYLTPGLEIWTWLTVLERVLFLGGIIALAAAVYLAILWFSGVKPKRLKRR